MSFGGGFFGGGEKNSRTTSTTITPTKNVGFNEVAGTALSIDGQGNSITMADERALAVASQALKQVEQVNATSQQSIREAVRSVAESSRAESETIATQALKWGTIAVVGVVALKVLAGYLK